MTHSTLNFEQSYHDTPLRKLLTAELIPSFVPRLDSVLLIEVIKPDSLRTKMREDIGKLQKMYVD